MTLLLHYLSHFDGIFETDDFRYWKGNLVIFMRPMSKHRRSLMDLMSVFFEGELACPCCYDFPHVFSIVLPSVLFGLSFPWYAVSMFLAMFSVDEQCFNLVCALIAIFHFTYPLANLDACILCDSLDSDHLIVEIDPFPGGQLFDVIGL